MSTIIVQAPTSRLRLGRARVEITPPVGIYHRLWGAARHDRATGVHRTLFADVLALAPIQEQSQAPAASTTPALVRAFLDLAGLVQSQHETMVRALAKGAGVLPEQVVLTYSHTHSSGWFVPDRIPFPGGELILPYLEMLEERLRDAGRQAADTLRHAGETVITYATGHSGMGANRDFQDDANGIFACGYNPDAPAGLVDNSVVVARFANPAGTLSGSLVHYACHPTTLAWENSLISPDFAGALRETVERETGAPCIFAQGACGDVGPKRGFTGDTEIADRNGREVAYSALAALTSMGPPGTDFSYSGPVISGATLGIWDDAAQGAVVDRAEETAYFSGGLFSVDLPLKPRPDRAAVAAELADWVAKQRAANEQGNMGEARDYGAHAERARRWLARLDDFPDGETFPLQCAAYRLGDAIWAACGGEPYNALQAELRRRFPERTIVISPLLGDLQVAYLLRRDAYGTGRYQEEPSILAPGCLEQLIDAFATRIAALG
jgi:hypothetical protein